VGKNGLETGTGGSSATALVDEVLWLLLSSIVTSKCAYKTRCPNHVRRHLLSAQIVSVGFYTAHSSVGTAMNCNLHTYDSCPIYSACAARAGTAVSHTTAFFGKSISAQACVTSSPCLDNHVTPRSTPTYDDGAVTGTPLLYQPVPVMSAPRSLLVPGRSNCARPPI
jgi:hypothetical protein